MGMMRQVAIMLFMLLMIVVLGACGGSEKESGGGTKAEPNSSHSLTNGKLADEGEDKEKDGGVAGGDDDGNSGNELDDKRKAEPRQAPTEFPLPKLEGWVEGSPFEKLTTGKKEGWSAEFFYEDAIEDNAKKYEKLLLEQGYQVEANAMVEASLGKGFIVTGHISGIFYSGSVVFDTNAEKQNRVWLNFTEKKQ